MSAAEQIFGAGGKRMRPALVFLVSRATAELVGLKWVLSNVLKTLCIILNKHKFHLILLYSRELTVEHRRLAEIIEMIHTASLIHDDVLDDSDIRRGKLWLFTWKSHLKSYRHHIFVNRAPVHKSWASLAIPTRIILHAVSSTPMFLELPYHFFFFFKTLAIDSYFGGCFLVNKYFI